MKTYNSSNFFKHTFCEFHQVDDFDFPENTNYKSKSNSYYFYTEKGVYRKSNHWGRVANCRWKLITKENYKNQKTVIGFANWSDFYPINSDNKLFIIHVDFKKESVKIKTNNNLNLQHNFTFNEALKREQKIKNLFKKKSWASYFNLEEERIIEKVITEFISTDKSLQQIKNKLKNCS